MNLQHLAALALLACLAHFRSEDIWLSFAVSHPSLLQHSLPRTCNIVFREEPSAEDLLYIPFDQPLTLLCFGRHGAREV